MNTATETPAVEQRGCDACRVIGPLLTGPGTSGRTWYCECGTTWPAAVTA